jgi:cyclase
MGVPEDLLAASIEGGADAVAMADIIHYGRSTFKEIREVALNSGISVRNFE